ncbi:hypothetical protein [Dipodfec virus UOA04_Rod_618]|nr:hypothetical protein [Dipodfec virus UOA04_Rod_618]
MKKYSFLSANTKSDSISFKERFFILALLDLSDIPTEEDFSIEPSYKQLVIDAFPFASSLNDKVLCSFCGGYGFYPLKRGYNFLHSYSRQTARSYMSNLFQILSKVPCLTFRLTAVEETLFYALTQD